MRVLASEAVRLMDALSPRQRRVLERLYLSGDEPTYEQVGCELGISGNRVRQLKHVAFREMRHRIDGVFWP